MQCLVRDVDCATSESIETQALPLRTKRGPTVRENQWVSVGTRRVHKSICMGQCCRALTFNRQPLSFCAQPSTQTTTRHGGTYANVRSRQYRCKRCARSHGIHDDDDGESCGYVADAHTRSTHTHTGGRTTACSATVIDSCALELHMQGMSNSLYACLHMALASLRRSSHRHRRNHPLTTMLTSSGAHPAITVSHASARAVGTRHHHDFSW
jgi:hypothetical protein